MVINRLQNSSEFRELNLPEDYLKDLSENSTDELLDIIAKVTATMLRHLDLPENDISDFTDQVKERNMAELFENFVDDIGLIPKLKIARETYIDGLHEKVHEKMRAEGREKVLAEVREEALAEVRAEGESRFAKLIQLLLEADRTDDLSRAVSDPEYRKKLYLQNGL